jgi:hypothetical protein
MPVIHTSYGPLDLIARDGSNAVPNFAASISELILLSPLASRLGSVEATFVS